MARHPDFDLKNPNRVRALVSSFASGNQVRFHDASGGGYRFLADIIVQLDPINGQVAARMVSPLGQWRRVDIARQEMMKQELQRVLDAPGLSKGTFEMASRSLAQVQQSAISSYTSPTHWERSRTPAGDAGEGRPARPPSRSTPPPNQVQRRLSPTSWATWERLVGQSFHRLVLYQVSEVMTYCGR